MSKKGLMGIVLAATVMVMSGVGCYYWYMATHYVVTDDARVDGAIISISPQISGKIAEIYVNEGDNIKEGESIFRQTDFSLSSTSNIDLAVIKSPIAGTVIKKVGNVGEVATPGYPVVMLANLKNLYITAEVDEKDVYKIKPKQMVDFTIDAFPAVNFTGQVVSITQATTSTFSLLPAQNTGDNFTKVVQRIPVKISVNDDHGRQLMPGMNTTVKIHIAG